MHDNERMVSMRGILRNACLVITSYSIHYTKLYDILPTLFFYVAIVALGSKEMPPDTGAILGSYLGLVFLAAAYASIGIFASSLTDNSIIAFILAVLLCFFFFLGFNSVGYLSSQGAAGNLIINLVV